MSIHTQNDGISKKNPESNKQTKLLNLMIDALAVCEVRRRHRHHHSHHHHQDHKATCDESPPSPQSQSRRHRHRHHHHRHRHRSVPFKLLKLLSTLTIVITIATLALAPGDRRANCLEFDRAPRDVTAGATMYDLFPLPPAAAVRSRRWSPDDLGPSSTKGAGHGPNLMANDNLRRESIDTPNSSIPPDTVHSPRASHHLNESRDKTQVTTLSSSSAAPASLESAQMSRSQREDQDEPQQQQQQQQQQESPPAYKWYMILPVILMFVGATGNILVCMAVLRERRLQTATNYFLLSLACADLLVCTLVMPFGIVYEFYGRWPFDWRICNLWVTCDVLTCSSSILHMCCISVGRYIGIRNPLHARQANLFVSRRAVLWRIAIAWIASVFITSPITLMSIHNHANIVPAPGQCAIANKSFMVFGSLFAFFIPMFVMVPSYVMTVRLLSRRAKFVRNDSLSLMAAAAAANQHTGEPPTPNGFAVPRRAKASSAGDCSPLRHDQHQEKQTGEHCNNIRAVGRHQRGGPKRAAARYSSPSHTRGFSSTDLEEAAAATGAPSQVEISITGGRQPPPLVTDMLRRTQRNFWAGLLADVNNNDASEKDNQPEQPETANQRSRGEQQLRQPLLPEKLEESIKSCRFIDDEDCEGGGGGSENQRARTRHSGESESESDCSPSSLSSVATIVERDANLSLDRKKHDEQEQSKQPRHECTSGPRNARTCTAAAGEDFLKTCACPAKANAVDNRARCAPASRSSSSAKVAARRALRPTDTNGGGGHDDEGARSQSCTTCLLLLDDDDDNDDDIDIDIASDRTCTPTKRARRCISSSLSPAVNGYSRPHKRVAGNHDDGHNDDKFDDRCAERACERPLGGRLLDTSGQGTTTNDSINSLTHNMAAPHKANLCSNSCVCSHTNGYASREQTEKSRRRPRPQTVIMPAVIALNDHCLANDCSGGPLGNGERKIHHSNYPDDQSENQSQKSGNRQHCCHRKQDNDGGGCTGCCCCPRHHRSQPLGDVVPMDCTISCTTCMNRARTHHRHHHQHRHRHRHRRRQRRRRSQEESRPACMCASKRRQASTPTPSTAPGSRSARVQHAHRKSPAASARTSTPLASVDAPEAPAAAPPSEIKEQEELQAPVNLTAAHTTRQVVGGSVIFKVPVASSEKQQQQQPVHESTTTRPGLTNIKQQATMTGNGQITQANNNNNNNNHLLQQRVHAGGREPPQMIRYLGSSMQVRSEQKATRVLGGVFFFFIFCWTPFFFSNFLSGILERDLLSQYIPDSLMTCFLWLGYSSSTVNPIIYTVANRNFRRAFVRLLLCREPVGRRQYRQSRSSEYYKSFRFSQYPTASRQQQPVILDKE